MEKKQKTHTVRRLLLANALALLAFAAVSVLTLWALGLWDSIVAFIF